MKSGVVVRTVHSLSEDQKDTEFMSRIKRRHYVGIPGRVKGLPPDD